MFSSTLFLFDIFICSINNVVGAGDAAVNRRAQCPWYSVHTFMDLMIQRWRQRSNRHFVITKETFRMLFNSGMMYWGLTSPLGCASFHEGRRSEYDAAVFCSVVRPSQEALYVRFFRFLLAVCVPGRKLNCLWSAIYSVICDLLVFK